MPGSPPRHIAGLVCNAGARGPPAARPHLRPRAACFREGSAPRAGPGPIQRPT